MLSDDAHERFRQLARMPLGELLLHITSLDAPGLVTRTDLDNAVRLQRHLIAIAAIKHDLHHGGPLGRLLTMPGRQRLLEKVPADYLGPVHGLLERFAETHLIGSEAALDALDRLAGHLQRSNAVPPEVPSFGYIVSSSEADRGPGRHDGASA
jgi:hypothetical protein